MFKSIVGTLGCAVIAIAGWTSAAQAVPVMLTYSGVVREAALYGSLVNVGDTVTFEVIADNGGNSLVSQSWQYNQIVSTTFSAGGLSANTSGLMLDNSNGFFRTNASGVLSLLGFHGIQYGSDTLADSKFSYFMGSPTAPVWQAVAGPGGFVVVTDAPSAQNTTISFVSAVPLPAALPLLASGLGGLGLLGWRKKRRASTAVG